LRLTRLFAAVSFANALGCKRRLPALTSIPVSEQGMNLVMTSIFGMNAEAIDPFFRSLRTSGYRDEIVVFVAAIPEESRELLRSHQATVIDVENRSLPVTYASLGKKLCLAPAVVFRAYWKFRRDVSCLIVNCWRFFRFHSYLQTLPKQPDYVLLADVRDVVFQSDPFAFRFPPGLSVASERSGGTIGQSRGNSKWLWECAGYRQWRKLSGCTPVCSGTIVADGATMKRYLELMTQHLRRSYFWGLFDAIDQGLHNYFVHNRMIAPLQIFENWQGPFLTMDSEVVTPERKTREGYLCNRDGSVVPIVHQYDRVKNLYHPGEPLPECWKFSRVTASS
jgi:hypothetical protein